MIGLPGQLQVAKGGSCFSPREVRGPRRRLSLSHLSARGLRVPRSMAMATMAKRSIFSVTMRAREPKSLFKRLDTPLNAQFLRPPETGKKVGDVSPWWRAEKGVQCCIPMFASCQLNFLLPGEACALSCGAPPKTLSLQLSSKGVRSGYYRDLESNLNLRANISVL